MQKQNLSEYDFVRRELAALRNCITTYMGFVKSRSISFMGSLYEYFEGNGRE